MFMDGTFSQIGHTTGQTLNALRRQLGVGVDPTYDYTEVVEIQKKLLAKDEKKNPNDDGGIGPPGPASSLEALRRALREVVGNVAAGGEDGEEEEAGMLGAGVLLGSSPRGKGSSASPADVRNMREQTRNTRSFKAPSRNELCKLDIINQFRAPPIGSYRPKDLHLSSRPRLKGTDFNLRDRTRSLKVQAVEQEIAKCKEEKKPFDHLVKHGVSIEMHGIPDRPPEHMATPEISKMLPRPDLVKQAGIVYNTNSFSAGVLDGDLSTSKLTRKPEWDFAKTSTAVDKMRETYFQPGQYKMNLDCIRPKIEKKNIPFQQQQSRKPLRETVGRIEIKSRPGDHLPDRSLSRSCPLLSNQREVKVPNISHYTVRPNIISTKTEYHDVRDMETDQSVMSWRLSFDATEAKRPVQPTTKPPTVFDKHLNRHQDMQRQRSAGENVCLVRSNENIKEGPRSVELLSNIDCHPSLQHRVKTKDFCTMAGREHEKEYIASPPRQKDFGNAIRFERSRRTGDACCSPSHISPLAHEVAQMRASRSFQAMADSED